MMEFLDKKPIIFVIGGKARSGKDTVANIIKEYYNAKKVINLQYSYYIKEYAKKISNWDGNEQTKPRQLLCDIGTDLVRKEIDYLFFVKRTMDDIMVYRYFFDIITISDSRFKEEITIPKKEFSSVYTIGIERPNYNNDLTNEQKGQIIETDLDDFNDYDYVITNDDNLEALKNKTLEILSEVEKHEH